MTTHSVAYELVSSRSAASAGLLPSTVTSSHAAGIPVTGPGSYAIPYPLVPPSGYTTVPVAEATLLEFGATDIATVAWRSSNVVTQGGSVIDNGEPFLIREEVPVSQNNSGRLGPRISLKFATAVEPSSPTSIESHVRWAYEDNSYQGLVHFCEFEERPPDSGSSGVTRLRQLTNLLQTGSNSYLAGVNSAGTPIVVPYCGFAALAPEGAIFIRPEDLGNGPDQIPTNMAGNTAEAFRAHPSVFFTPGRAKYMRGLMRQAADATAIDFQTSDSGGPLGITNVDSSVTSSLWLVMVDGQPCICELAHPEGSDLRRPRDIYAEAWVPVLNGPSTSFAATEFLTGSANLGGVGFRWAYADYFRCLGIPGTNVTQIGQS